jgi:hypothetical protein
MDPAPAIRSVEELLSVTLAMERAAAARYAELAHHMAEHEHDTLTNLFAHLRRLERDHARFIERRFAGRTLPEPADAAGLEAIALDDALPLTPHAVLVAALRSEARQAHLSASPRRRRRCAAPRREMAAERPNTRIGLLRRCGCSATERHPAPRRCGRESGV